MWCYFNIIILKVLEHKHCCFAVDIFGFIHPYELYTKHPTTSAIFFSIHPLSGGGFALSTAAKKDHSDLNGKIGDALSGLNVLPNIVVVLIIIILTVIITNFASNVAVCNVLVPIAIGLVSVSLL